ncbi:MAG: iron-containing alcohol dehydrogenase family protein [Fusobacteriaceae bacterium]|jgi:glycerol dehydrogenase|nr:iron-containing alcohol dehydrogenase family protein [Fusobacteriaceae bacterium]
MSNSVFLPNYTIGADAYQKVVEICEKYGEKVVFVGGKTALSKASDLVREAIKGSKLEVIDELWYGGEASYENVEKLKATKSIQDADMVFAFGGGKAIDTCKCLTKQINKPFFTFPTISSTCASVTTVCAIYHDDGVFNELCWRYAPAEHAFINSKVIAEAPDKYLWAGIGDTMAKGYEPEFSARGKELNHLNTIGVTLSTQCQEPLVKYGTKALESCKNDQVSNELEETILAIIVTTGLVSNAVINDYNSSIAHAICYGCSTVHNVEKNHLHGELVSYGVLVLLMIDNRKEEISKLLKFYKSIDLPTTYNKFEITPDELENKILKKASEVPDIDIAAFHIDKDVLRKGVKDLEEYVAKYN